MAGPKKKRKLKKKSNIVIGGGGNQAGPGGPGSDTYNPNLSAQNQLQAIVDSKQNLQNQAGAPAYADPTHKFHKFMQVPKGGQPTQAQLAIADFYKGSTPNAYQQALTNFTSANPVNMQVYKERFPIASALNTFFSDVPEALFEKSLLGQGIKALTGATQNAFAPISDAYVQGKQMTGDLLDAGMSAVNTGMSAADDALGKGVDIFQDAIAPTVKKPKTFTVQNAPGTSSFFASPLSGIPSLLNTSTDTPGMERIFKLPSNFKGDFSNQYFLGTSPSMESFKDNYLVRQPEMNALMGLNLNQGGLASLNNTDYGMLMNASNFGF